MDPLSLIVIAATYGGAAVAQQCAEKSVEGSWSFIKSYVGGIFGRETKPEDFTREALQVSDVEQNPEVLEEARRIFGSTPALRRAALVVPLLRYAQVLWVDDNPSNNIYEQETLRAMGANIDVATTTSKGIHLLQENVYDIVISDMDRGENRKEGLEFLQQIRAAKLPQRVVFYVGRVDPKRGVPEGAFGITRRPDELLHLVMDVLERQRV